jgi:hypothetical protein
MVESHGALRWLTLTGRAGSLPSWSSRWNNRQRKSSPHVHVQEPEAEQNAASARVLDATSAYVLDKDGRIVAELTPWAQQPPEQERPQAPERAAQPRAAQTEQPAGGGPLVGQALHEHIAQAIRPVLGVVLAMHLGIAQAPREDEQDVAPTTVLVRPTIQPHGPYPRETAALCGDGGSLIGMISYSRRTTLKASMMASRVRCRRRPGKTPGTDTSRSRWGACAMIFWRSA